MSTVLAMERRAPLTLEDTETQGRLLGVFGNKHTGTPACDNDILGHTFAFPALNLLRLAQLRSPHVSHPIQLVRNIITFQLLNQAVDKSKLLRTDPFPILKRTRDARHDEGLRHKTVYRKMERFQMNVTSVHVAPGFACSGKSPGRKRVSH